MSGEQVKGTRLEARWWYCGDICECRYPYIYRWVPPPPGSNWTSGVGTGDVEKGPWANELNTLEQWEWILDAARRHKVDNLEEIKRVALEEIARLSPRERRLMKVVHCCHDAYDVYIGRGGNSIWGNPWVIGPDGTREEVIERYELWLREDRSFGHPQATSERRRAVLDSLPQLRGKVLGCWCEPPLPCHGGVLLKLLSELDSQPKEEAAQGDQS